MDKKTKVMIPCLLLAAICSSVFSDIWKATVVRNIDALVESCVVIPCSFSHTGGNLPTSRLRAMWHYKDRSPDTKGNNIYHDDPTMILDNFKGRTRMLGHLGQNNCTLEITDVKNHDNGPFCFRIELVRTEDNEPTKDKFSFVEDCAELNIIPSPPKPTLIHPKSVSQGEPYTVMCSVIHTCPTHVPELTWNLKTSGVILYQREIHSGKMETLSILTFIAEVKDDNSELTCTAEFSRQQKASSTVRLSVTRIENYNHIIIPSAVGIGIALLFGILCIFMAKKYKNRIAELQNQDGTMWNRLSRLSRR
uniref:Ig-like domain-containing protein n=1 Tax=Amphilophus citrinellus TaxID=61819 RepID=A0A3Q0SU49_AMPCI